jgi:hypothetical protein
MNREKFGIFLVSASIIGFQLAIINLLSYSQWHHFAYLAVSIAMLGFGSSGVVLSVWPNFFKEKAELLLPWLFLFTGISMFLTPVLVNFPLFRFDTFLLFSSNTQIVKLFVTCFLLFIPFLLGATVLGLFFIIRKNEISLIYAWNLAGSGFGGVTLIWLSYHFLPMHLSMIFGFGAIASALLIARNGKQILVFIFTAILGIFALHFQPSVPFTSEFKLLSKTLLMPQTWVEKQIPLPQGTLELIKSENIRQASGLSLNYTGEVPTVDQYFLNAQPYMALERAEADSQFYRDNLFALPYLLGGGVDKKVLMLQSGSSFFPSQAVSFSDNTITLVEPLKPLADSLTNYPWPSNRVLVENSYPRDYLFRNSTKWDYIVFPLVGNVSSAGLGALQEQYLLTTNAVIRSLDILNHNGVLVFSSVMDNPPRYALKLISMLSMSLREKGLSPSDCIIAVRNWNSLLIIARPSSFRKEDYAHAHEFANNLGFDMVHPFTNDITNILSDSTFQSIFSDVISSDNSTLARDYSFNLSPPTDDSPFFSQFMKIGRYKTYLQWFGAEGVLFLELGYLIVWASLLVCLILAIIAIAFPLIVSIRISKLVISVWIYFALLGLGYMLFEVSLIQRSILTLGNPVAASALIISVLLCFSAVGSYFSGRMPIKKNLLFVLLFIGIIILLLGLFGNQLTIWAVLYNFSVRIAVLVVSIAPLSVLMGMAFPFGMRYLSEKSPNQIPIAWGVNGFCSVLAAPLATIIAVEASFLYVLLISSAIYIIAIPVAFTLVSRCK